MPHPFDAASKHLIRLGPADYLALAGLPIGTSVEMVDTDLSVVSSAADYIVKVDCPSPYLAHFEFQTGSRPDLDTDVLLYNVLARRQHRLEVKSVVFALRPAAVSGAAGAVFSSHDARHRLEFTYQVIRAWELPPEQLLRGGLGTIPLAPISNVTESELPSLIDAMSRRFDAEATPGDIPDLWALTHVMMGLRWSRDLTDQLLKGARQMRDSVTYQAIVEEGIEKGREQGREEGREEGLIAEARSILLRGGSRKLGAPSPSIQAKINQLDDRAALEALNDRLLDGGCATWEQLVAGIA